MVDDKIFNKEISSFLNTIENQTTVSVFKNANIYHSDYYNFLDGFAFDLGLSFMNIEVVDEKNHEKTLGFLPTLRFHNDNVFNEKAEDIQLSKEWLDKKISSSILARSLITKIFNYDNLETFIKEKNYKH